MEDLISSMSNMIYHIARQFTNNDDLIKELYNQGVLGLYDAYNNYNKNSDTKFSSYAYMYIYGKIYSYINENRNIKINKDTIKLYKLIQKAKDYLCQTMGKEPSAKEISEYLNIDEYIILNTFNLVQGSLSLNYEYNDGEFSSLISLDNNISGVDIKDMLESLSCEQRKVIMYKYYGGYSQSEIAKLMNMSQSSVSRCEKESIEKLRVRCNV